MRDKPLRWFFEKPHGWLWQVFIFRQFWCFWRYISQRIHLNRCCARCCVQFLKYKMLWTGVSSGAVNSQRCYSSMVTFGILLIHFADSFANKGSGKRCIFNHWRMLQKITEKITVTAESTPNKIVIFFSQSLTKYNFNPFATRISTRRSYRVAPPLQNNPGHHEVITNLNPASIVQSIPIHPSPKPTLPNQPPKNGHPEEKTPSITGPITHRT